MRLSLTCMGMASALTLCQRRQDLLSLQEHRLRLGAACLRCQVGWPVGRGLLSGRGGRCRKGTGEIGLILGM
uniref:Uncharacterized protein n=1 Tax=Thermogemmatispora argillosa TaxID=2045280 RepID=A0A455T2G2_9CHLR|nr:hypothetical protein KTA_22050 [Thermogemmatispora argillosa]